MSQCVPSWDLDDTPNSSRLTFPPYATPPNISTLDYEVAELTWENGQLAMHGLGPPRALGKSPPFSTITATKYNNTTTTTWDKPRAGDTLESIVNQATTNNKIALEAVDLVPWFDHHRATAAAAAPASPLAMDALVPSSSAAHKRSVVRESSRHVPDPAPKLGDASNGGGGCSTRVESCSGDATIERRKTEGRVEGGGGRGAKRARAARVPTSAGEQSASGSATFGGDSRQVTLDTCDLEFDAGFGSTSLGGSQDNTTAGNPSPSYTKPTTVDDHDSVAHSRPQREAGFEEDKKKGQNGKSSVSTKRSRAAAIHNQSERKRRDKINQKMKTLQKLVPNSSKTDKASMLDEVIEYIKQLQAQVQMMSRLNMPHMMIPMTLQQQLQMSLMTRMSMGMGMGLMDMNPIAHHHRNLAAIPPILNPAATFMPMASWDGTSDRLPPSSAAVLPDPLSAFLACQTQQMRIDTYNRIASLYQQVHQGEPPVPASKT